MSNPKVDQHPAAPDRGKRGTRGVGWLVMAGSAALAIGISLAAFLLIIHYVP